MKLKKGIIIPLIITIILLIGFSIGYWYIYRNDYVFKLNGEKITMLEFNTYLNLQKSTMEAQLGENVWDILIQDAPAIEFARDSAKHALLDTKIKLQKAREMKISLTNEEKQFIKQAVIMNGTSLMEANDITFEELLRINEDYMLISKLEVENYKLEDHSTHNHGSINIEAFSNGEETGTTFSSRHILFNADSQKLSDNEIKSIKSKAEKVLKRIKNGEDFADLAKEFSEDPGSKENGGLYEAVAVGSFVPEYEDAVMKIKDGEVYPELVKSSYGYHIIKREKVNESEYLTSNETQNVLTKELNEKAEKWLSEAEIEVNEQQYNSAQ